MRKSSVQIAMIIALMCCFAFVSCERAEQMMTPVMPITEETTELIVEEPELPKIEASLNPLFEEYQPEPVEEIEEQQ